MAAGPATQEDTRTRLLATALRLFTEHGVEGTSLQMIADALGVTKAAVYYHFKTKDEIVEAVAEPGLRELGQVIDEASRLRRRGARIDHLLTGFVDTVVRHRALVALFSSDPGIARALARTWTSPEENFSVRILGILVGEESDLNRMVAAHVAVAGIALAGGSPQFAGVDDDTLREQLLDVGRRLLGRPRRVS
ncbi:TetR/AcrR family transcriptional regulator [Amycolatopsis rhizosphaerae]|uniref:TetR/AcrR family transcriptional regulator n=1 Tax=Amycolatopsis rhizosphaerae TaxID=2053003 RepID=A0A558CDY4_9PSEU|nr:TetR/AcrR family transcriptional regulator [Amycolatopsis rhizosphaerae]TVT46973.1 TetR/AcrR family transcriptional regulator [Amycolatopsis rhizosphaerae]